MKKTAILFAHGYEEVEALTVVDLLQRAKIGCDIISVAGSACVTGAHSISIGADRNFSETDFSQYGWGDFARRNARHNEPGR